MLLATHEGGCEVLLLLPRIAATLTTSLRHWCTLFVPGCRFDLRLKPIQRAKFEALVDKRRRDQSVQEVAVTAVKKEAADGEVITLRTEIECLEREHMALDESMAEVKTARIDVQVATIPYTMRQHTGY